MNPFIRYPVRFTIPLLLLVLAFTGSGASYLINSGARARVIEEEAIHFVTKVMERNQHRLNESLQKKDMARLRLNVDLLTQENDHETTMVVDENQQIIAASDPAWQGLPMAKTAIHGEGKEQLTDFFRIIEKPPQGAVILSRDRQRLYAVYPLVFQENPIRMGLLYHEHDLRGLKETGQQMLRRDIGSFLALFTIAALFFWLCLYLVFYRRIRLIIEAMGQFGHGDDTARSALAGNDELAEVSLALDSMLDIKVAAEKQIREQARLLKQLTDGLPVLIAYVDKEERYRFVNQEFENWYYLKPEQIVGRQVRDLLGEEGYAKITAHLRQALSGKVVEYEDNLPTGHEDGIRQFRATLLPHFANGSGVQGCFLLAQDITQHRIDEDLLRKAKEQWECTFDSILDEIITVHDKEFRILQANSAAANFFGLPREEIVGKYCYELFREEKIPCSECPAYAVRQDSQTHSAELYHERLKKNFLITISPMVNGKDEIFGLVHSAKDITKFKQLEQQLRQAQKMEAIGTLAGGIAHDFNNILTPILGYSELVVEQLPTSSEERGLVQEILSAGKRAKELVKQILTFSRQTEQERQPVQIHLIIKEALKLLRASIPTTIEIKQNVVDCGMVMADPTQIHQVLMNLCTNAYHAMRETGGELNVSLSVVELTAQDYLDNLTMQPGPHVKLSVHDTGCGMPKNLMERIFEPYFTTKKLGEGTGLGLSVGHGIVQSHHGHITVYSEPGQGTEFHVYLPQVKAQSEELAEGAVLEAIPQGSGTLLVVDDEPTVGQMLRQMLLSLGYEVVLCASSTQALETFQREGKRIDLVLTDMAMPVMNGAELTRRLKQLSPATPVVLCTGFSDTMDEDKAKRMGLDGFLLKPVIKRQLAQAIHDALRKKDPC